MPLPRPVRSVALALTSFFFLSCTQSPSPTLLLPHDNPQEAEDFDRFQRLAWAEGIEPRVKYREALAWSARREEKIAMAALSPRARWRELGPGNIGGRVRTLAIDPVDPQRMLLGGVSGGVWRTDDGGAVWRATGDELANITINSMALDPSDPQTVFVGTGEGYFREDVRGTDLPLRGGGIYVSNDFGDHWTFLPSTASSDFHWVNDLVISSIDSKRVYAATRTGVWRSRDAGVTWLRVLTMELKGGCLDLALHADSASDRIFASCGTFTQAVVFVNDDAADDSSQWASVLSEPGMGRTSLAIAPSDSEIVYALSAHNVPDDPRLDQALFAVFRSDRGGRAGSWTAVAEGGGATVEALLMTLTTPGICNGIKPRSVNLGWYANVIAVDPLDPMRVWAGGISLLRSDDGGISWGFAGHNPSPHSDQHNITFSPRYNGSSDRTMFVTNDGGIFKTIDATAAVARHAEFCTGRSPAVPWTSLNHSLGVTQLYHGTIVGDTSTVIAGSQDNGVLRYEAVAGANGWKEVAGGDGGHTAFDPEQADTVFATTAFGTLLKSTNRGEKFAFVNSPDDELPFIPPMIFDSRSGSILWLGGTKVWRSKDEGQSWIAATGTLREGFATALALSPQREGKLMVGTSSGHIYTTENALESVGETWASTLPRRGFVSSIHASPHDADTFFATYSGFGGAHVWQSTDGGASWSDIDGVGDGRLPDIPVHAVVADPQSSALFIATDMGVYRSVDRLTWSVAAEGMPPVVTKWLAVGPNTAGTLELLAFTHGRGVWKLSLSNGRRRPVRR